jgi:2'-5' RNA ligase
MHGIVSLLDSAHDRLVEALWVELDAVCSMRGVYVTPFPHFSYHVAEQYEGDKLVEIVRQVARDTVSFHIRTTGLGMFTGAQPVLYLPIVRTSELSRLHHTLWHAIAPVSSGRVDHYHPDLWMPHITIGFGDVDAESAAAAIRLLDARTYDWDIAIDNLAIVYDTGARQAIRSRYTFAAPS